MRLTHIRPMFVPRGNRNFEEAVRPHLEVLYRVAKRITFDADEAADVVGQTLYQACRAWPKFEGDHVRSWLICILRNEALGNKRKRASRVQESELSEEIVDPQATWAAVCNRLDSATIVAALEQLPIEFRLVSVLCDVEQLSYEEAAEALEIPVGTIRSRLFRARAKLKKILSETLEGVQ